MGRSWPGLEIMMKTIKILSRKNIFFKFDAFGPALPPLDAVSEMSKINDGTKKKDLASKSVPAAIGLSFTCGCRTSTLVVDGKKTTTDHSFDKLPLPLRSC